MSDLMARAATTMSPAALAALKKTLIADVLIVQQLSYITTMSFTILTWDWIVCLSEEIRLIWKKPKTGASYYYIFFRFWPWLFTCWNVIEENVTARNLQYCRIHLILDALIDVAVAFLMSTMLQGRIYAMYNRSKFILYLNATIWVACVLTVIGLYGKYLGGVTASQMPPPLHGCSGTTPTMLWTPWIPTITMESVLCIEVVYKTYQNMKAGTWSTQGDLFSLLVRDYAFWYLTTTTISWVNIFFYIFASGAHKDFANPFFHCISTAMACHLVLNLKSAYYANKDTETMTITGFQFNANPVNTSPGQASTRRTTNSIVGRWARGTVYTMEASNTAAGTSKNALDGAETDDARDGKVADEEKAISQS